MEKEIEMTVWEPKIGDKTVFKNYTITKGFNDEWYVSKDNTHISTQSSLHDAMELIVFLTT